MPKVVINDAKGVTQSRGAGLHQLSASDQGFVRSVKSASVSLAGSNGSLATGINLPENAIVEKVAIKITAISVDAASNDMSSTITAISDVTNTWTLASPVNLLTASEGDILVYNLNVSANELHDQDALYPTTLAAGNPLTVTEVGATYDSAADTLGSFDIIVEYTTAKF